MSAAKVDVEAQAARAAVRVGKPAVKVQPVHVRTVRVTLDLAPQRFRKLVEFSHGLSADMGITRVPHVEVLRALLQALEDDAEFADRIRADIMENMSK